MGLVLNIKFGFFINVIHSLRGSNKQDIIEFVTDSDSKLFIPVQERINERALLYSNLKH